MSMGDLIQRLVTIAEEYFDCRHGERCCFFELPQRVGEDIRLIYVSYVIRGDDLPDLERWMIDNVLYPLALKAGDEARLWWRLEDCFAVLLDDDQLYTLRTRIVVTDKDLNPVILPDVLKQEGMPSRVIS